MRKIAKEQDLITAEKKDSQGLCFIGKVRLPDFLQQQLKPKEGLIVEVAAEKSREKLEAFLNEEEMDGDTAVAERVESLAKKPNYVLSDGKVVGKHQGAHYFTIGQRKGLAVGGTPEPLFVIDTDVDENVIYTGQGKQHPGLYRSGLFIREEEIHWVRTDLKLIAGGTLEAEVRIRYRQPLQQATLHKTENGIYVTFVKPQAAITEGQFAAWYLGNELIGSGVIS